MLIKPASSHWYTVTDGVVAPFYEVECKSKPGTMRPATLADARKVGALPSVTNILSVIAKESLVNWRIEQAILASLTLPRLENEPLEKFALRVVDDMERQREDAAALGTAVHAELETFVESALEGKAWTIRPGQAAQLAKPAMIWLDQNVTEYRASEALVGNRGRGYAGRLDLDCDLRDVGPAIIDFKTQRVKRDAKGNPKPAFYDEWPLQLAAYARLLTSDDDMDRALVSLVIDTEAPGVYTREWGHAEQYLPVFDAAFDVWRYVRGYNPVAVSQETPEPVAA